MKALIIGCVVSLLVALLSTIVVLWFVRRWRRLVIPSERSAHDVPMPTAGGIGIIVGFFFGHIAMDFSFPIYWLVAMAVLLTNVIDDLVRPFKVLEKTVLLLVAAGVFLLGIIPDYDGWTYGGYVAEGWLWPMGLCWFFWLCNVFNFMDGIDGISATQTLCIAGWMAVYLEPFDVELANSAWILACASAGFLCLNFPPARIFMGDVGSLFVGFSLAALTVLGLKAGAPFWHIIALLGYYIFDTSYTLIRRMLNGENLLRAHNKHMYQRLVRIGWSHLSVDIGAGALTMLNGLGIYCFEYGLPEVGMVLLAAPILILIYCTAWIERRDTCFA